MPCFQCNIFTMNIFIEHWSTFNTSRDLRETRRKRVQRQAVRTEKSKDRCHSNINFSCKNLFLKNRVLFHKNFILNDNSCRMLLIIARETTLAETRECTVILRAYQTLTQRRQMEGDTSTYVLIRSLSLSLLRERVTKETKIIE